MGNVTRTRFLAAAFCISLCGLGVATTMSKTAQVAGSDSYVIDDGDKGFSSTYFSGPARYANGYNGDTAYFIYRADYEASASWTFSKLKEGTYSVYATWGEYPTRAKNSSYTVNGGAPVIADQSNEPPSTIIDGRRWLLLSDSTKVLPGGTIVVKLKPGTAGITLADAVMITAKGYQGNACKDVQPKCLVGTAECCSNGKWTCPNGATGASGCSNDPVEPGSNTCGNGIVEKPEQCDDGNQNANDGCGTMCKICAVPGCVMPPRGCQYIPDTNLDVNGCAANPCGILKCEPPVEPGTAICGNGKVETPEQCDDGNRKPGDGCSSSCKKEFCGDGVVTPSLGEECDTKQNPTNGTSPYEGCTQECTLTYCGDGIVQQNLKEACDDGNTVDGDECNNRCQFTPKIFCGFVPAGGGWQCEQTTPARCVEIGGIATQTNAACFAAAPKKTCTDSDGGNVPETRGNTVSTNPQANETDICIDSTKLKERVCEANTVQTKEVTCPYGCEAGACKPKPVVSTQCPGPAATGVATQNQKLTTDVDNDGVVTQNDIKAQIAYYNSKVPAAGMFYDADGSGVFDIQDILHVINVYKCL